MTKKINRNQAMMAYAHHTFSSWNNMFAMCAAKAGVKSLDGKKLKSPTYYDKKRLQEHRTLHRMEKKGLEGKYDN